MVTSQQQAKGCPRRDGKLLAISTNLKHKKSRQRVLMVKAHIEKQASEVKLSTDHSPRTLASQ
jgi:hypothetical protein